MWPFRFKHSLVDSGIFRGFTDCHSHLLPGVDDGVQTPEEALQILTLYEEMEIREVWLTPHVMEDFPNATSKLQACFKELASAYKGTVRLRLAAEYMLDHLFKERLEAKDILPLGENADCLLVETSCYGSPMNLINMLEQILSAGYYPILAHPERYTYMNSEDYAELKGKNVRFQVNILSLTGFYGERAKVQAQILLKKKWVDAWGTDIHGLQPFLNAMKAPTLSLRTSGSLHRWQASPLHPYLNAL